VVTVCGEYERVVVRASCGGGERGRSEEWRGGGAGGGRGTEGEGKQSKQRVRVQAAEAESGWKRACALACGGRGGALSWVVGGCPLPLHLGSHHW
jgi:hypothetical protein